MDFNQTTNTDALELHEENAQGLLQSENEEKQQDSTTTEQNNLIGGNRGNIQGRHIVSERKYKYIFAVSAILVIGVIAVAVSLSTRNSSSTPGPPDNDYPREPETGSANIGYKCFISSHWVTSTGTDSNPLGNLCIRGTPEFEKVCPRNGVVSNGKCRECWSNDTFLAPSRCFCDKKIQFGYCDALRKSNCSFCQHYSPCLNGGTFVCNGNLHDHKCLCRLGYKGDYCEEKIDVYECTEIKIMANNTIDVCDYHGQNECKLLDTSNRTLQCKRTENYKDSNVTLCKVS